MTMQSFTANEKWAIIAVLSSIMNADGVAAPKELSFMNDAYLRLGININDFQNIATVDLDDCKRTFAAMSEEKKREVEKCFLQMVGIDGKVDLRELKVLHELF